MSTTKHSQLLKNALHKANELLADFAKDPSFNEKFALAFGTAITQASFLELATELPEVVVASAAELKGAQAAFSAETGKIYLSAAFLKSASIETLAYAILEETGHFIDSQVNSADSQGDEGAIFAGLVSGQVPTTHQLQILKAEDDHGLMTIGGALVSVENLSFTTKDLTQTTASDLANALLGPGFTASNVSFSGSPIAAGFFSGGLAAGISIDSGIILSTGNIADSVGPNNASGKSSTNNAPGDIDLDIIVEPQTTKDAAVLTFDFTPTKTTASFSFVFASEEYPEFANTAFNDVFALYVNGQNTAVIPGTTTPVSINNLNNLDNPEFYVSNHSASPSPYDTQFDGFTTVLSASAGNLAPGIPVTIKLAIADTTDSVWDSAVFLQADSLGNSTTVNVVATDPIAVEGTTTSPGVFTFSRSGSTANPLTVSFVLSGSADGTDYSLNPQNTRSITIPAGQASTTLKITPVEDSLPEGSETAILSLIDTNTYDLDESSSATVILVDNEASTNSITLSVNPDSISEGSLSPLVYTFTRSGSTTSPLTANFTIGGSAVLDTHYKASGASSFTKTEIGKVAFAAGSPTATVKVTPIENTEIEANKTVDLTLAPGDGYTIGTAVAVSGTIINNDQSITLQLNPDSVEEDGPDNLVYTFIREGSTSAPLTVNYTLGGTAKPGADYTQLGNSTSSGISGTVTFNAGSATTKVTLDPIADPVSQLDKTVVMELASGSGYSIASGSPVTGVIKNTDSNADVALSVAPASVTEEGDGKLLYTFTRTGATTKPLTVNYTVGGSATFNSDYTQSGATAFSGTAGTITFAAGATTATLSVDANPDPVFEDDETVELALAIGTGYSVTTLETVTGTILKDVNDGPATYVITGTPAAGQTLTMSRTVSDPDGDGTGIPQYRWQASSDGIKWTDRATTPSYTVTTADLGGLIRAIVTYSDGDGFPESVITSVELTNSNADVSLSVAPASVTEEGDAKIVYTFTRTGPTTKPLTVNYEVGGSATFNADYTQSGAATFSSTAGTVTFAAGAATATVSVDANVDTVAEGDETVALTLADGPGYTATTTAAVTATILKDVNDGNASFAITGTPSEGQLLTVTRTVSDPDGDGTPEYLWQSSSDGIKWSDLASTPTYKVTAANLGQSIRAIVTYSDGDGFPATVTTAAVQSVQPSATSPQLLEAVVDGDLLTLSFDSELANTTPPPSSFTIRANGALVNVVSISTSGAEGLVTLILERPIEVSEDVTAQYRDLAGDQTIAVIQGVAGRDVAPFTTAVTNITPDLIPPSIISASVNGKTVEVGFNELILYTSPQTNLWTVREEGRSIPIASAAPLSDGSRVALTLSRPVSPRTEVSLSYSDLIGNQRSGVVEDLFGNDLPTQSGLSVVNETQGSIDALKVSSAEVDGKQLTLTFDRELDNATPSARAFRVSADGSTAISVASVETLANAREVVLELAERITSTQRVVVSYLDSSGDQRSGVIQDLDGNDLASFSQLLVRNITAKATRLELSSAEIVDADLTLTFNEPIAAGLPAGSRFKVFADGKKQRIQSLESSPEDGQLIVTLKKPVFPNQEVKLTYTDLDGDQKAGIIQDANGKDLASLRSIEVSNLSVDEEAPVLKDAFLDGRELSLEFDEIINPGTVPASRFSLLIDGERTAISAATIDRNSDVATLLLDDLPSAAGNVAISYRDPRNNQLSGVLEDLAGNDMATFRSFAVDVI